MQVPGWWKRPIYALVVFKDHILLWKACPNEVMKKSISLYFKRYPSYHFYQKKPLRPIMWWFIFFGFVLFSINCEFLCMYQKKKDWSPLFFDKLTFYCKSMLSFFIGSRMMKKTNLCTSGFQRPHTLEKSMSKWNHEEVNIIIFQQYPSYHCYQKKPLRAIMWWFIFFPLSLTCWSQS